MQFSFTQRYATAQESNRQLRDWKLNFQNSGTKFPLMFYWLQTNVLNIP